MQVLLDCFENWPGWQSVSCHCGQALGSEGITSSIYILESYHLSPARWDVPKAKDKPQGPGELAHGFISLT